MQLCNRWVRSSSSKCACPLVNPPKTLVKPTLVRRAALPAAESIQIRPLLQSPGLRCLPCERGSCPEPRRSRGNSPTERPLHLLRDGPDVRLVPGVLRLADGVLRCRIRRIDAAEDDVVAGVQAGVVAGAEDADLREPGAQRGTPLRHGCRPSAGLGQR